MLLDVRYAFQYCPGPGLENKTGAYTGQYHGKQTYKKHQRHFPGICDLRRLWSQEVDDPVATTHAHGGSYGRVC